MGYVTLTTAQDVYHAHFLGEALEEAGIQYIQANENTATILPYLNQGILIRVKDTDFLKARVIADRIEQMRRYHCPNCDSIKLKYMGEEDRPLTLTEIILKLVRFPVRTNLLIYNCLDCNTTFKTK